MPTERLRLFVALDLPERVREALLRWRSAVVGQIPELRPVATEALHVTLCFLGSQPEGAVDAIAGACEEAVRGQELDALTATAGQWLPRRRPRVLAVELADPSGAVARVQGAIAASLSQGGWYTPEKRPFLAHVTVARVPSATRLRLVELPPVSRLTFYAPAVTLYRSRLQRSGARYEPLASFAIARRPARRGRP